MAGNILPADPDITAAALDRPGTIIYTERFPEFSQYDVRKTAVDNLQQLGINALIVIGGDGSYRGAQALHEMGIHTIGIPATIDNDIPSSDYTIGFDTALTTIVSALSSLSATATSHRRCIFVEVMGHGCGDLALYSGIATNAGLIITNDTRLSEDEIISLVREYMSTHESMIVVVSEFIYDSLADLASRVEQAVGIVCRATILGHIQRGGQPTPLERYRAYKLGCYSIELLADNKSGLAVGFHGQEVAATPILEALRKRESSSIEETKIANTLAKI